MTNLNASIVSRANAEGINVQKIKQILSRIHRGMNHGVWQDTTTDADVADYHGSPEYRGGYIYSGWKVLRNDIMAGADILETRWSKSPSSEPTTCRDEWTQAVNNAPVGSVLQVTCFLEQVTEITMTKVGTNAWERITRCSHMAKLEEEFGVTLYVGIRQDVAKEMGVETSSTFHKCFEAAVDTLML